jgi:hypothetical protein
MNEGIIVAIITASATILGAAITYMLTKRHEWVVQWQNEKINHYKVLFSALSDLAVDGTDKHDANMRFALAVNTIALVAPQFVIKTLMAFHDEIKFSNQQKSVDRHDALLKSLLLAVRKDIGRARGDEPASFVFHLIGSAPK